MYGVDKPWTSGPTAHSLRGCPIRLEIPCWPTRRPASCGCCSAGVRQSDSHADHGCRMGRATDLRNTWCFCCNSSQACLRPTSRRDLESRTGRRHCDLGVDSVVVPLWVTVPGSGLTSFCRAVWLHQRSTCSLSADRHNAARSKGEDVNALRWDRPRSKPARNPRLNGTSDATLQRTAADEGINSCHIDEQIERLSLQWESLALRRSWLLALFVAFCLCNATTVPSRAVVSWDNQSDAPTQTMA